MKGKRTIPAEQDPRFEALLTAASQDLAREQEREADRLFEQLGREPEIESSPEHLADMQSLLQKAGHSRRQGGLGRFLLQWAACLALAACVGSVAFPTQATAVWQQLRSFVYRQYVTHTEIHISAPESEIHTGPTADEFTPVRPSYIPEGFVCTEEEQLTILSFIVYERNEQRISFQQMFADGTGIGLDTEDAYTKVLRSAEWKPSTSKSRSGTVFTVPCSITMKFTFTCCQPTASPARSCSKLQKACPPSEFRQIHPL